VKKEDLLARIDTVIAKGQATLDSASSKPVASFDPEHRWVGSAQASIFRTAGLSLLQSIYGDDHQLYDDFETGTDNNKNTLGSYRKPVALLVAVREEVDRGWLDDTRALIAADIFANILEMAEYLLSEGYKDAAAVLVGGSLEGHLRNLATRHNIDITSADASGRQRPRKAEMLNQDLQKAKAYTLGDQKQITAWLDLRNDAAHGDYNKYNNDQTKLMHQGVQGFILRVPV
jgi:hypothetical protein